MIGFISAVDRDESQSVTIDFHDRSSHIATKFEDKMKYDKASLGASLFLSMRSRSCR